MITLTSDYIKPLSLYLRTLNVHFVRWYLLWTGMEISPKSEHLAKTFALYSKKLKLQKNLNFDRSKCEGLFAKSLNWLATGFTLKSTLVILFLLLLFAKTKNCEKFLLMPISLRTSTLTSTEATLWRVTGFLTLMLLLLLMLLSFNIKHKI